MGIMDFHEEAALRLGALYERRGYTRYRMSKFEEYDLYARNKDFLISDSVITFTDTNGRLMALKPDVTLSIVRNSRDDAPWIQKVYYKESVYRVAKGTGSFREIPQVGLEALGAIDDYTITEVLTLAAESLGSISSEAVLEISHMGAIFGILKQLGLEEGQSREILGCISRKNRPELTRLSREWDLTDGKSEILEELISLRGTPVQVLPRLKTLCPGETGLIRILEALAESESASILRFDFSAAQDSHYYNGIVFHGFVPGVPERVLSGGQYDRLMEKMGRKSGAIGFAVYLDSLQRLEPDRESYDAEHLLLYADGDTIGDIRAAVKFLEETGGSVLVQQTKPENIRCRNCWRLEKGRVVACE